MVSGHAANKTQLFQKMYPCLNQITKLIEHFIPFFKIPYDAPLIPKLLIFHRQWKWSVCVSHSLSGTPQTAAHQAPLSMEFSRQEHWSGLTFPSPGENEDGDNLLPITK